MNSINPTRKMADLESYEKARLFCPAPKQTFFNRFFEAVIDNTFRYRFTGLCITPRVFGTLRDATTDDYLLQKLTPYEQQPERYMVLKCGQNAWRMLYFGPPFVWGGSYIFDYSLYIVLASLWKGAFSLVAAHFNHDLEYCLDEPNSYFFAT
ncbi:hypothetical protein [Flocculibacter collagenilyticus]|uniref:hypothetical protein n=1 Tax=Flocculibacter collagenilyticus TaxID=2744479 RepID=UPI0018F4C899|nr:hypothetical protein [Flocculibacter collagenilyticus]